MDMNRTVSAFPLSIGTSLAFESLFNGRQPSYDPERKIERVDIKDYTQILINVWSLHRNIIGAFTTEQQGVLNSNLLYQLFAEELELIEDLCFNEGEGKIRPIFYLPSYESIYLRSHKNILLRKEHTQKQLHIKALFEGSIKNLNKDKIINEKIIQIDSHLAGGVNLQSLILTHVPYDLLSHKRFKQLDLIESHTGTLKKRSDWPSKYHKGKEIPFIPFQEKLLKILGDSVMFHPQFSKIRHLLIEIAKKGKWTAFTTEEKVRFDLDLHLRERYLLTDYYDVI